MKIETWNNIMQKFQEKYGWERGMKLMLKHARKVMFVKFVPDLNLKEETILIDVLRKVYNKNE